MSRVTVSEDKSTFCRDKKPFFYLADTIWSAFTNITEDEWIYYLKRRKEQGFNVLQINTMPQWDRCISDIGLYPFATADGHRFDFTKWNEAYYEHAVRMCELAEEEGFQLALVVLWLNYVPGTWGSKVTDCNVMPKEFVKTYTGKIVHVFDRFEPIYIVSGDTDFDTPEAVSYYRDALDVLCEKSPHTLKTMHIKRGYDFLPEEFLEKLDFYMFQSGHNREGQDMAYVLPENFRKKYPKKPLINAEPCYEQMGFSRKIYGRFQAEDTRKAAWSSILSGACAGVAYGAHGIWNWQKLNKPANPILGEGFDAPFPWNEALQFPGAWDYGMIRQLLDELHTGELIPAQEVLENETTQIRMAQTTDGRYLLYLPHSTKVVLNRELNGCSVRAVDLASGHRAYVSAVCREGKTEIAMHPFYYDALLVVEADKTDVEKGRD